MSFTDAERLRATTLAIMRYNAIMAKEQTGEDIPIYSAPVDWIDISTITDGNINLLVSDGTFATYVFVCTTSTGTYHVDWGDGASNDYVSGEKAQHTYAIGTGQVCSRGYTTFKIVISPNGGNLISFGIAPHSISKKTQRHGILSCVVAATNLTTLANMFYNVSYPRVECHYLEQFRTVGIFPLATDASNMFAYCRSLQSVDTSGMVAITNVYNMFTLCRSLQFINLSRMIEVTDASYMFNGCSFLQSVDISRMVKVINAFHMFSDCSSLQSIDISKMIVVTNASYMFSNCYSLKSIDINWMVAVTNASYMFQKCYSLKSIDINGMVAVTNASYMFTDCITLQSVDISGMTAVTNASYMFNNCYILQSVDVSGMIAVTDASGMFTNCKTLQFVDVSGMTEVGYARAMFSDCSSLQFVNISGLTKVYNTSWMFSGCSNLQSIDISSMTKVTDASFMFKGCSSIQSITATNFSKNATSVTFLSAFTGCEQLAHINFPEAKMTVLTAKGASGKLNKLAIISIHASSLLNGTNPTMDIQYNTLSGEQLNTIFTNLPTVTAKTINITGCTGAATCTRTIATAKGWTVTG